MPYLNLPSGLNWYYEAQGAGPALLFLHGFSVNSRIWRQQSKYFAGRYQVITVDFPGHGKTPWQKMTLREIAEDVESLLSELGCEKVGVVASSFGGLVALKLLELNKKLIRFFVFAGSQPKFCRSADYPYGLDVERIHKLAGQLENNYPAIVNIFFRSLFTRQERQTRRFKWIQTFKKTDFIPHQQALLAFLKILEKEDLREVFYSHRLPILFINGREDDICPKELYENLGWKIPSGSFRWLERCGHFPFLSQPHEFNEAVDDFLSEQFSGPESGVSGPGPSPAVHKDRESPPALAESQGH